MTIFSVGNTSTGKVINATADEDSFDELQTEVFDRFNSWEQFEVYCVFEYLSVRTVLRKDGQHYFEKFSDALFMSLKMGINAEVYKLIENSLSTDRVRLGKSLVSIEFK